VSVDLDQQQSATLASPDPASVTLPPESLEDERIGLRGQSIPAGAGIRVVAAMSYLGVMGIPIALTASGHQFAYRHSRVAASLHVARFVWLAVILGSWWATRPANDRSYPFSEFMADAGLLLIVGIPRISTFGPEITPWIATPLVVMWLCSLTGVALAISGRSADFDAFAHANWNDVVWTTGWSRRRASEERRLARMARQRQLDRLQRTALAMAVERERRERRTEVEGVIQRLQAERDHIEHLFALGEISQRRFSKLSTDISEEVADLRSELNDIVQRTSSPAPAMSRMRAGRLDRAPESDVDTIAIVSGSGVPLFSYGHFLLDEALVGGILSAFDSISEEVFGSRVHKTELAEGQVLHFAHGQHVILLAIFVDEPSPRQIEQLRLMLQQFELANAGPLARQAHDPDFLHEVQIPFRFHERA
jgi:hypothetical protein